MVPADAASLGVPGPRPPPRWVPPFHAGAALPQRVLLRECGAARALRVPPGMLRPAELAGALRYHKTFRGHRSAVYCVVFDKSGRYVATGSDDRLVKASASGWVLSWVDGDGQCKGLGLCQGKCLWLGLGCGSQMKSSGCAKVWLRQVPVTGLCGTKDEE